MAISIRTNASSLDAQRNLTANQSELDSSMRKLASGYRVTRAADDAAGLAVSEKMRAAIGGTNQAVRNANDGISMIQTAEGGLSEISNIVQRVRELAVQGANGTLVTSDHTAISKELSQLKSEIDSVAGRTKFNGISLLDDDSDSVTLQVGADNGQTMEVAFADFRATGAGELSALGAAIGSYFAAGSGATVTTSFGKFAALASKMILKSDTAIESLNNKRAELGAAQNRLGYTIAVQQVSADNLSAANSRIRDVDVASESAKMTRASILSQAGVSSWPKPTNSPSSR